jgi:hypothetical protein
MQINTSYNTQAAYHAGAAQSTSASNVSNYLKGLKERFPNANINIGDFESPQDIKNFASGQIGSFNGITISGKALEKMANDPKMASRIEGEMQTFLDSEQRDKDDLAKEGHTLLARGMVVDKNGDTSFWMVGQNTKDADSKLESIFTRIRERTDELIKQRAKKKAEEKKKNLDVTV